MKRTRRQKAAELMKLVRTGPYLLDMGSEPFTPQFARERTKLWLETWVEPLVKDLIPETKEEKK